MSFHNTCHRGRNRIPVGTNLGCQYTTKSMSAFFQYCDHWIYFLQWADVLFPARTDVGSIHAWVWAATVKQSGLVLLLCECSWTTYTRLFPVSCHGNMMLCQWWAVWFRLKTNMCECEPYEVSHINHFNTVFNVAAYIQVCADWEAVEVWQA